MFWRRRGIPQIFVVDVIVAFALIMLYINTLSTFVIKQHTPSILTMGIYAITMQTPNNWPDDVDLWVQDPQGNIVYFANTDVGLMHLEHDVIPSVTENQGKSKGSSCDCERTILRGVIPGEYTVNVHMYARVGDSRPEPVTITLYRIIGGVKKIIQRKIILKYEGQEITAFRFTLNQNGFVSSSNQLQKSLMNKLPNGS